MINNPIPWPNGARCACVISFDMDADSLIHIARPTDSYDRLYPISMGRYGPQVAVPRILETYRRLGIKQSFFIPGWCIETYPEAVEAILAGGHEIGHHGYLHEDPIDAPDQRDWFEKALAAHHKYCGGTPAGYRAPVYNINQEVVDLLIEYGFRYDSSMMADDIPYRLKTARGGLWEMPVHWGTDDWPPFAHYAEIGYMMPVKAPSAGLAAFWEEFDAAYEAGGFFMLIVHPFLTGRLARWKQVETWLEGTLNTKDVWFARLD
ncbi:MAG: polysaccharide deacetylase family protein, partial [Candidatus Puniceispirillaceae bacterium]